jgi:hypothetical protein
MNSKRTLARLSPRFATVGLTFAVAACAVAPTQPKRGAPGEATGTTSSKLAVVTDGAFTNVYVYRNPSQESWDDHLKHLKNPRADIADFTRERIDAFTDRLMAPENAAYFAGLHQYSGVNPPQFFGSSVASQDCVDKAFKDADAAPGGVMQGSTIRSLSNCHLDGMDPAPQVNLIFSPDIAVGSSTFWGNTPDMCTENDALGRHPIAWHGGGVNTPNFTVMPTESICEGSFTSFTQAMSHEIIELLSDPGVSMTEEEGDKCEDRPDAFIQWAGFSLSRYWSDADNTCVPLVDASAPPPQVDTWLDRSDAPLIRFTGDVHDLVLPVPPSDTTQTVQSLSLVISTGNDDLRGGDGGDNCDVTVTLTSGNVIRLPNVNLGQTWRGWTKNTVSIPLPAGTMGGAVASVALHTGFGGGIAGDNWNVERVQLLASVSPAPQPQILSLLPSTGAPGGGTSVRVQGNNFDWAGGTQLVFGGVTVPVSCSTNNECVAVSPPGSGAVDVMVAVKGRGSDPTLASKFYYSPSVTGLSASTGTVNDSITVQGIGLVAGTTLTFGGFPVTTSQCDGSTCQVIVPPGAGAVDVLATVNGVTTSASVVDRFTYQAPTITGVTPAQGSITGGKSVVIKGQGFDPYSKNIQVFFDGVPSSYVLCNGGTWCEVRVPAVSKVGPVHVTANVFGTATQPTSADVFTYTLLPGFGGIYWGGNKGGTLTLDAVAPAGGAVIALTSSDPSVVVPPSTVTIPAGQAEAGFVLDFLPTTRSGQVTITATYDGTSKSVQFDFGPQYVTPPIAVDLGSMSSLGTNQSATVSIDIATPAPAGGAVIALSSSVPSAIAVPATVTIPAGSETVTFPITNVYKGAPESVTITATYQGTSATGSLYVPNAPVDTCQPPKKGCPIKTHWNTDDCACESANPR